MWASALGACCACGFFNTVTRLDISVSTIPPPLCSPLLSLLSHPGDHILSLSSRGVGLSELHLLRSLPRHPSSCCQMTDPFSKQWTSGMRLGGVFVCPFFVGLKHPHVPFPECLSLPPKSVSRRRGGAVLACFLPSSPQQAPLRCVLSHLSFLSSSLLLLPPSAGLLSLSLEPFSDYPSRFW